MTALLSFLWSRNNALLRRYLVDRPRVVLTYAASCNEELRQIVQAHGGELVALETLLGDARRVELRHRAIEMALAFDRQSSQAEWRDFLDDHGLDGERFDPLVREKLSEQLFTALYLVEVLDVAAERYQIELALLNEDLMLAGRTIALWARARGVPSLHLAHGLALSTPYTVHSTLHCDAMAVFGERDAEAYCNAGFARERLYPTGNPAWDGYAGLRTKKAQVRALMYEKYRMDPSAPLLLFGTTWAASLTAASDSGIRDNSLAAFLVACQNLLAAGQAANIVVKDRPSNADQGAAHVEQMAQALGYTAGQIRYTMEDTDLLILAADVLVSVDSNLSVEAMLAGTPSINLMYEFGLRLGPSFESESGVLEAAPEELAMMLDLVVNETDLRERLVELMRLNTQRYNTGVDGRASERVVALMRTLARRFDDTRQSPSGGFLWEQLSHPESAELMGTYHDHPRKELLGLMERPPLRVLDVGCATGATGELIKTAWPESHVTGIELNRAAAARAAERIDKVLGEKLEDIDFASEGIAPGSVDTVILADVLEHLYDPWDALVRIRPLLTEDAQVLVSLPNARNLWLLNELASGRFSYAKEGLLDITHIRWFTRREMERMLRETGYRVLKSGRTSTAGMEGLTRPPGSTTVETEKILLKDVSDEEFEDLKSLQILFLAKPMQEGEDVSTPAQDLYQVWQLGHSYLERDVLWMSERMDAYAHKPRFHLVIIVPPGGLERLANNIKSLGHQFYREWRLSIVSSEPAHPAFAEVDAITWILAPPEAQLAAASGVLLAAEADWVGQWEAGDKLAPHALFAFADCASRHPQFQVIYSDEDQVDAADAHAAPYFKTDFNLEMLRAAPFVVGGLLLLRHDLFAELGGFDSKYEGVQAFDLTLRAWEQVGHAGIGHIADVLYHRHVDGGHNHPSGEEVAAAHKDALERHLDRCGLTATLEQGLLPGTFHVRYPVNGEPLVSILISTKNQCDFLRRCITTLVDGTGWSNCEILVLDNGSDEADAIAYLDELRALNTPSLRVLDCRGPFNFSAMNNQGAREARGEYLVLLNNDTAVLHEEWLTEMLGLAQQADVGVVGAKLYYPNGTIQHAGVILGIGDMPADHGFMDSDGQADGYFGRLKLTQELSAVTAACMLVKRALYLELGGLDEQRFQVSFNDVDFCLRAREKGYRVVFTPHARLLHEGSVSQRTQVENRSYEAKKIRFNDERTNMLKLWRQEIAFDPAYNRNLSVHKRNFDIEVLPCLTWNPEWRLRPRILAHPADRFGCGEYRIISPMRALNEGGRIMGWETGHFLSVPESFRMQPDSIVLQRQVAPHQIDQIEIYKQFSQAFCVFEIDDLITNIPIKSSRKQAFVEQKDLHKRFRKGIAMCDRFIVSTEYLAQQYKGYSSDIVVVPNYIERARWGGLQPQRRHGAKPRVGWAGSDTHDGDLAIIFDVIKALAKEVDWVFLGMCPDEIRPHVTEYYPGVDLAEYPAKLASLDLDLAVAPLEDVPFNHGKSHLRLLEYGVLGYPVICTDLTPYRGDYPVIRVPNRYKDWMEAIRGQVADRDELARRGDVLREYIHAHWILEDHLDVWERAWLP